MYGWFVYSSAFKLEDIHVASHGCLTGCAYGIASGCWGLHFAEHRHGNLHNLSERFGSC